MRILLILGAMPENSPYVNYYQKFFDSKGISYDICAWNRYDSSIVKGNNIFTYTKTSGSSSIKKIIHFLQYRKFILNHIRYHEYDRIIVFTIAQALLISNPIIKKYKNRFIIDIRDYSPLLQIDIIKRKFLRNLLSASYANVISSPGFKNWLPADFFYVTSHNAKSNSLKDVNQDKIICTKKIKILTIGALRDPDSNIRLVHSLGNDTHFLMQFSGKGNAMSNIKDYVDSNGVNNVIITGKYNKEEEEDLIVDSDMINILLPHNMMSDYLMSNRFYHSVIHGKPMIVNSGCTQSYYASKYNLGVIINDDDDIAEKILEYWNKFDLKQYNKGRSAFMEIVKNDIVKFIETLENFIEK